MPKGKGIAVDLSTKILPHNFLEILDAMIDALRKNPIDLLPDFLQGGIADWIIMAEHAVAESGFGPNEKVKHLLKITEIPYGTTTTSLIDSILSANDKNKIKVSKIEDNASEFVEILVLAIDRFGGGLIADSMRLRIAR